jgi:hypothetical protein
MRQKVFAVLCGAAAASAFGFAPPTALRRAGPHAAAESVRCARAPRAPQLHFFSANLALTPVSARRGRRGGAGGEHMRGA